MQTLPATSVNCPFDIARCTPDRSSKAETKLIPGRLADLYKEAARIHPDDPYTINRVQSGITELLARVSLPLPPSLPLPLPGQGLLVDANVDGP